MDVIGFNQYFSQNEQKWNNLPEVEKQDVFEKYTNFAQTDNYSSQNNFCYIKLLLLELFPFNYQYQYAREKKYILFIDYINEKIRENWSVFTNFITNQNKMTHYEILQMTKNFIDRMFGRDMVSFYNFFINTN